MFYTPSFASSEYLSAATESRKSYTRIVHSILTSMLDGPEI